MSITKVILFGTIFCIYIIAGVLFATLTPHWQAPDEPAHYNYIRYLATEKRFPELVAGCYNEAYLAELKSRKFPADLSIGDICYEFHQPPLYYLLATPIYWAGDGSLVILRLLSVVFGAGIMVFAFLIAQTIFPNTLSIALGTMAFVAFVPMHIAILASVNNDSLAELILAALLFLFVRTLFVKGQLSIKYSVLMGVLLGLGLLTKTTVYIAVPLVIIMMGLRGLIEMKMLGSVGFLRLVTDRLLHHVGIIYIVALLIALPWFGRNAFLYGDADILGLKRHDAIVVGQLRTAEMITEVGYGVYLNNFINTTFRSFWGQFGWMAVPMDNRVYLFLTVLTCIALGGGIAYAWKVFSSQTPLEQRSAVMLMASVIVLMFMAYSWYNLTFVQFQGRYLFPSLIPLGFFFALGLHEVFRQQWGWGLAAALAIVLLWIIISTGFQGGIDKWAALILGLAFLLVVSRQVLSRYWTVLTVLLLVLCYAGLGFLTLIAPFWFVIPYL
ncbi:MAG: DUF2142 domain-containing protein [Anaerolineae bacterium]|nr:DUF2142 domain-containing protein [Anaerolineae bacterium]